jgi:hypothetical protein
MDPSSTTRKSDIQMLSKLNVYLDNNIVVSLEDEEYGFEEIKGLFPRTDVNFFYSAAHVYEAESFTGIQTLSKTDFLNKRFDTIRNVFKNNYLYLDLNGNVLRHLIEDPQEVYNTITEVHFGIDAMKGFTNLLSKEMKEEIRRQMGIEIHKLNNYEPDSVVKHLNTKLPDIGTNLSFIDMIEFGVSSHPDGKTFGLHNRIAGIFELLDMFGYWKDKETGTSNYARLWDADHCYNASYCDYFVSDDKRTRNKSKVVYDIYEIGTKVISKNGS